MNQHSLNDEREGGAASRQIPNDDLDKGCNHHQGNDTNTGSVIMPAEKKETEEAPANVNVASLPNAMKEKAKIKQAKSNEEDSNVPAKQAKTFKKNKDSHNTNGISKEKAKKVDKAKMKEGGAPGLAFASAEQVKTFNNEDMGGHKRDDDTKQKAKIKQAKSNEEDSKVPATTTTCTPCIHTGSTRRCSGLSNGDLRDTVTLRQHQSNSQEFSDEQLLAKQDACLRICGISQGDLPAAASHNAVPAAASHNAVIHSQPGTHAIVGIGVPAAASDNAGIHSQPGAHAIAGNGASAQLNDTDVEAPPVVESTSDLESSSTASATSNQSFTTNGQPELVEAELVWEHETRREDEMRRRLSKQMLIEEEEMRRRIIEEAVEADAVVFVQEKDTAKRRRCKLRGVFVAFVFLLLAACAAIAFGIIYSKAGGSDTNNSNQDAGSIAIGDNDEQGAQGTSAENSDAKKVTLRFLTDTFTGLWLAQLTKAFEERRDGAVSIDIVEVEPSQLAADIVNEAKSQIGLYDGFVAPPSVAGSVVMYDGWKDLKPFIQESTEHIQDWSDILLGYRQYVAQYEKKIVMFPLDGDILSLYYRKDVLKAFNLTVPRTWEEYGQVAAQVHGKQFKNKTLTGSCIDRTPNCAGAYWANLIISSMTQTEGQWSGHLFDPQTMQPLTGEAIEQALQWMETQVLYGRDNEFDHCLENIHSIRLGECVLTYNWGNAFKQYLAEGSMLRGNFGVSSTPGSHRVLDRTTNKLVDCDEERCRHGTYYDDIGWVNKAPYLAFGGWACAINNYANEQEQRLATEFCAYASSQQGSMEHVIANATTGPYSGTDPFRESHLNLDLYVQHGYEAETAAEYIQTIREGIDSNNVVTDIRFPTSSDIYQVLDHSFANYLNKTKHNLVLPEDRSAMRAEISQQITTEWQQIIDLHDQEKTSQYTILESYQKLRGVYG